MNFDFNNLLGKKSSPGQNWGALAQQYFSQKTKDSKRNLKALVASLFFNATENKMQSKVFKNLEALEAEQTLEKARLTHDWDKRQKIQNEYDAVKNKGAYAFYKSDAESAFEVEHGGDSKWSLAGFQPEKIKWMQDWAAAKEKDLDIRYKTLSPDIKTIEEFSKPTNDYFAAKKADILNPQNTSLVHKGLGMIGFGDQRSSDTGNYKIKDKEGNFKDVVYNLNEKRNENKERIQKITDLEIAEINLAASENDNTVKITNSDLATLIDQSTGLSGNSSDVLRAKRSIEAKWLAGNKTYQAAQDAIASSILSFDTDRTKFILDTTKRDYIAVNGPRPTMNLSGMGGGNVPFDTPDVSKWDRGFQAAVRAKFEMPNLSEDRLVRAEELFELGLSQDLYTVDQRKDMIKEIIQLDVDSARGVPNLNQWKADMVTARYQKIMVDYSDATSGLPQTSSGMAAAAQIKGTPIIEIADREFLQKELGIDSTAYKTLKENGFDMSKWNDIYSANKDIINSGALATIRSLQEKIWLDRQSTISTIGANSIVNEMKLLFDKPNEI